MTSWDLLYHILRANFDGLDGGYVKPPTPSSDDGKVKYQYGSIFQTLREVGKRVEVEYANITGAVSRELAHFVIGADGAGSKVRHGLNNESVRRSYAGYVAFRGTVPEASAPHLCRETFVDKFTFYDVQGTQILT